MGEITRKTLFAPWVAVLLAGCAVTHQSATLGRDFPENAIFKVHPGMPREQVITLLGKPYAEGVNLDGEAFVEYTNESFAQSSVGVGAFVAATRTTLSSSGATARIIFDAENAVKRVEFEIKGEEGYARFGQYLGGY